MYIHGKNIGLFGRYKTHSARILDVFAVSRLYGPNYVENFQGIGAPMNSNARSLTRILKLFDFEENKKEEDEEEEESLPINY